MTNNISRKLRNKMFADRRSKVIQNKLSDNPKVIRINHSLFHIIKISKSEVIKFFALDNEPQNYCKKSKVRIDIPECFSITNNTEETLLFLSNVASLGKNYYLSQINISHDKCKEMCLSSSLLFDIILKDILSIHNNSVILHGKLPDCHKISDMILASGIVENLKLSHMKQPSENIKVLKLIKDGDSSDVSTKVSEFINDCLKTKQFELTHSGLSYFAEMVGEIIDNCYNHSGLSSGWYTIGHFCENGDNVGECNISIINFGNTIYNSILEAKDKNLKKKIEKLSNKHTNFFCKTWTKEALYALYALQDGVSSMKCAQDPDRGTGTIKLIHNLQKIGQSVNEYNPVMSILSGRVIIKFDNNYKLNCIKYKNGISRYLIAFNKRNSLNQPPDAKNVISLNNYFPGTIITLKFFIDKKYLSDLTGGMS